MTQQEIEGQIQWFTDLRKAIEDGETDTALASIDSYLKLLRRMVGERVSLEVRS